jgi:DNA-binding LytR/AlgR family response regulator
MTLKCAIIDNDPVSAGILADYGKRLPILDLQGTYNSTIAAMKDLRENPVDLLFLDIQMPELSGLEFAKILPKQTKIVFTSNQSKYAVEGYKVNALGYLMKPVNYEEFVSVSTKAMELFKIEQQMNLYSQDKFIFVKSDYKLVKINLEDILYIEGLKDYVKIYVEGHRPILSLINMKKIDETLPHPDFMRVHRSYIVHMCKINMIDRGRIVFGEEFIPISESYKSEVQRFLDCHTLM